MDARDDKELYEELDALADTLTQVDQGERFAVLLMAITGTEVNTKTPVPSWAFNPDTQAMGRRAVLRWLKDRGYQRAE